MLFTVKVTWPKVSHSKLVSHTHRSKVHKGVTLYSHSLHIQLLGSAYPECYSKLTFSFCTNTLSHVFIRCVSALPIVYIALNHSNKHQKKKRKGKICVKLFETLKNDHACKQFDNENALHACFNCLQNG